jgi:hypothetical protein
VWTVATAAMMPKKRVSFIIFVALFELLEALMFLLSHPDSFILFLASI